MGYLGNRPTDVPLNDADIVSVSASKLTGTVAVNQGGTSATTPVSGFDSLTVRGADIASASTVNLDTATGNIVDITGTTNINTITLADGNSRMVRFTGVLTLVNSSNLVLPGGANMTTTAGEYAEFIGYSGGVVRCVATGGSGAVAGGAIYENSNSITSSYTLTTGKNAMSAGPITIVDGVSVTIPNGQRYVVI